MIPFEIHKLLRTSIDELLTDIEPSRLLGRFLFNKGLILEDREVDLGSYGNVYLFAGGKASISMIKGIDDLMPFVKEGISVFPEYYPSPDLPENIKSFPSGHPVPTGKSLEAGLAVKELAEKAGESDLFLCLISGGLSAMVEVPLQGVTLKDISDKTESLLRSGADIHQLNSERKKISQIKGGKLTELAYPAEVISFILSDVPGNDLSVIGSGMTVPESAKSGTCNILVGSNDNALKSLEKYFAINGYKVIRESELMGESRECAEKVVSRFLSQSESKSCMICGGETTVSVKGSGKGGRNQEFALSAALQLIDTEGIYGYAFGTDGVDGPTTAAGAFFSSDTIRNKGLAFQHLENNDSNSYFMESGGLITTGPTGSNVMDVAVLLKY